MKKSKFLALAVMALFLSFLMGCGKDSNSQSASANSGGSNEKVTLTFFNTSAEVNTQFSDLFETYHESHPDVTITLIPTPIGGQQIQQFQSLLASKKPATIANLDIGTIYTYKSKFMDFTSERSYYDGIAQSGAIDSALLDNKLIGIPYTVQGYGLLYNKRVVDKALGKTFDPSTIKTRDDLEELFKTIQDAGVPPVMIHGANWSVGAHYLALVYALQSKNVDDSRKFIENLENGSLDLGKNQIYNNVMDTFDILKKYNYRGNDPLVGDYAKDASDFATGKVAFFFMGDWIWSQIGTLEGIDKEYGIMPVPFSNNASDYGNSEIPVSEPKLWAIDNSGSTPEQQAAAKDFVKWALTSKEGQEALVQKMGFNLPYKDVTAKSDNVISDQTSAYIKSGKTINIGILTYLPSDYYTMTGNSMLKYLAGKIDRAGLTAELMTYWKSQTAH
ncbi:ABC transporter substrate-binding protein [uncultured Sphaerochaeta sp.]|uniref:ABC transporter substrate-binding protein n=1 Tax=uncultured Sphaerochaeta sp. TaxID=886478 RepID=UPI002A0A67D0|nr:ABC transporter substrate-binding protein [uncultured Sphaerochaeta sp.]